MTEEQKKKEKIEKLAAVFCDQYCRFPREYDEDVHGVPLAESHICLNCPLNDLGGINGRNDN